MMKIVDIFTDNIYNATKAEIDMVSYCKKETACIKCPYFMSLCPDFYDKYDKTPDNFIEYKEK